MGINYNVFIKENSNTGKENHMTIKANWSDEFVSQVIPRSARKPPGNIIRGRKDSHKISKKLWPC